MIDISPFFRYEVVRQFLSDAARSAPTFRLRDWSGSSGLIVRHDVDCDVTAAVRFAEMENEVGVDASYFFLTTASSYNPATPQSRAMIRHIANMGFEVGLHFDVALYPDCGGDELAGYARRDADYLSHIADSEVVSLSLHNPSVGNEFPMIEGFLNAYHPDVFDAGRYLSDSRMTLRHDPWDFLAKAVSAPIQILLHPFHFSERGDDYKALFHRHFRRHLAEVDERMRVNSAYVRHLDTSIFEVTERSGAE